MARFLKLVPSGKTLYRNRDYNGAIELLKQAFEKKPYDYNILQELAICNDNY